MKYKMNTALIQSYHRGFQPPPDLTISEWADRYRMLTSKTSAIPGRYKNRNCYNTTAKNK